MREKIKKSKNAESTGFFIVLKARNITVTKQLDKHCACGQI